MTKTKSSFLLATLIPMLALTAWAATPGGGNRGTPGAGAPQGGRANRGAQAPAGLEQAMSDMDRNLRTLKTDAADPAKAEAVIRSIDLMIRDTAIAKLQVPPSIRRLPADKQAEATKSYHAMMMGVIKTLVDLEEAVNDKKPDDIKKNIAQLEELEKQGHAEFNPPRGN